MSAQRQNGDFTTNQVTSVVSLIHGWIQTYNLCGIQNH